MSGDAELAAIVAKLRSMKGLAIEAAKEAAPLIDAEAKRTAAAGTDPDGNPWPPKHDGERALPKAASAISAVANGAFVILRLAGAYVYHQRAKPADNRRPFFPTGPLPPAYVSALRTAAQRAFERLAK